MSYHFPPRNKELCMRSSLEKIICELGKFDTVNLNCRAFTHIFLFIKKSRIIRNPVLYSFAYTEMSYLYTQVAHLSSTAPSIVAALLFHHYVCFSLCLFAHQRAFGETIMASFPSCQRGTWEKLFPMYISIFFVQVRISGMGEGTMHCSAHAKLQQSFSTNCRGGIMQESHSCEPSLIRKWLFIYFWAWKLSVTSLSLLLQMRYWYF